MTILSKKRCPTDFEYEDGVMSNFDHEIDEEVVKKIKNKKLYGQYSGWDFCGDKVWWDKKDKRWCCEVWVYHNYQETFEAKTLEEIMEAVSEKYGYD